MTALEIDLSSMPKGTVASRIVWGDDHAIAESPYAEAAGAKLDKFVGRAD
jgi:hypothetical protein